MGPTLTLEELRLLFGFDTLVEADEEERVAAELQAMKKAAKLVAPDPASAKVDVLETEWDLL